MTTNLQYIFDELMAIGSIDDCPDENALDRIGTLIDVATELGKADGIGKALEWCDALAARNLRDPDAALLSYFRANAWAGRQQLKHRSRTTIWDWEQPELQEQVLHLRRAIRHAGYANLDHIRQCQIQTNLGNQLSHIGRFVEALPLWEGALAIRPRFGMALGNLGYGLKQYGHALYDRGHAHVFFAIAHARLTEALAPQTEFEGFDRDQVRTRFAALRDDIEKHVNVGDVRKRIKLSGHKLGMSNAEQNYRRWVLAERLFLNPLNDIGPHPIAARDILSLPNYKIAVGESPTFVGLFNQMKQEYVSARYFVYESVHSRESHFSDRDVLLYNTLDYPSYGLAVERAKAAFRIAYSIFDKIAYFLNDYAKLAIDLKRVYFRTLWYLGQDERRGIGREELVKLQNWPLRGLFWLAKDIYQPNLHAPAEPDAQELYEIRNCLEHRYLKVHELLPHRFVAGGSFHDRLAHSIRRDAFIAKTLLVLRLARAGLIYLSLGMHQEEGRRETGKAGRIVAPMHLGTLDDKWKL